jgi:hypothetical protein
MSVMVSLRDIVNEMVESSGHGACFLNRRTGELLVLNDHPRQALEIGHDPCGLSDGSTDLSDDMRAGNLVELPHKFEHQEFSMREQFCHSIKDPDQREPLFAAIRGKRAFRDFDAAVKHLRLEQRWHGFRSQAFEKIAIVWLDQNDIAFTRAA